MASFDFRRRKKGADETRVETAVKGATSQKKRSDRDRKAAADSRQGGRNAAQKQPPKAQEQTKRKGRAESKAGKPAKGPHGEPVLEIIPIGGLGEIGKNLTAFRYGDEMILVDCGMSFPDGEMLGIDIVIADYAFIEQNQQQLKALVVTHGHEDHIGGVPFLLKRVDTPVYATRLTLGLIKHKLDEHGIKGDLRRIDAGGKLKIGPFRIEAIRATHSVADSLSFAIETPAGTVFHTGDFKIDYTPIDGDPMDFQKLAEIGKRGVDLMLCDSTNALRNGFSQSEKTMAPILDKIFGEAKGRIIIATFASNVHRVQTIINTAVKHKRKVALSGRSMLKVMEIADELGYLSVPKGAMVDLEDMPNTKDKRLVIITTGSQGEPMSALSRMATGDHRHVRIQRGDTVILSSSPIPGNEKTISGVINSLLGLGAEVIYSDIADIHVSGHASREEIKIMISLLKPKYYMPVHGENKHLLQNAAIAENLGIPKDHILVSRNGRIAEMCGGVVKLTDRHVPAEPVFVDGLGVGDIGTSVLRDRRQLAESGLIVVAASFDAASGFLVSGPEVFSRGFVYEKQSGDLIEELRREAEAEIGDFEKKGTGDWEALKGALRGRLKSAVLERTGRTPVILPIVTEV
ncbi:MAG: ribonuclease J [Clostridiales Family XIII bacterium]|jgi:ribonuclease J|nr:ribonuclease J [Clostridiales Family XIII bacterium]